MRMRMEWVLGTNLLWSAVIEVCEYIQLSNPELKHSVVLVRKRTTPTERLPFVGEVSANFWG
jgi:hypothetical protein